MRWFVDDAELRVLPGVLTSRIDVDGRAAAKIDNQAEGRFPIPWRGREVWLVRFRVGKSAETEVWAGDKLVPAHDRGPGHGPPKGCRAHGKKSRRRCAACGEAICRRCCQGDGARCASCLEDAQKKEADGRRRAWLIGAGVMVLFAALLFFAGSSDPGIAKFGGVALFGAGYMVYTAFRARRSPDSAPLSRLVFEAAESTTPQLAGQLCRHCDERIATEKQGHHCDACSARLHRKCRKAHRCRPPKRGPDWDAIVDGSAA